MAQAPHFQVDLDWRGGDGTALTSGRKTAIVGTGTAVGGDEQWSWNPEELLLGALGLCLMRTFEALARQEKLHVEGFRSRIEATLAATPCGPHVKLGFTLLTAHVAVSVPPSQMVRARELVVQAKQFCLVANALMPPVHLELVVEAAQPLAAATASGR